MKPKTTPLNGKSPTGEKPKPRKPSPKRMAAALSRKLVRIDRELSRLLADPDYSSSEVYKLEKEQSTAIKEAKKALNLVSIPVADGSALYYEARRTTKLITFEWLYAGGDGYVSDFGKTVAVPLAAGKKLIRR